MMCRLCIDGPSGIRFAQQLYGANEPLSPPALNPLALPQGAPPIETPDEVGLERAVGGANAGTVGSIGETGVSIGPGTTTVGLVPRLPISVEPRGIPALLEDAPTTDGVAAEEPEGELPVAIDPQPLDSVEGIALAAPGVAPLMPPPSKEELAGESPEPAIPTDPAIPAAEHDVLPRGPRGAGLNPPGLSSTAPSGIPAGPTAAAGAPNPPKGDVISIVGGVEVSTCARLGPLKNGAAVVMTINTHAAPSLYCFRIGSPPLFRDQGSPGRGVFRRRRSARM
jgi:hypothetical protein